ncbi:hypothetical protein E3O65_08165 [Cryobacterium breve]|uniref:Uncharacterized protein n=1 Tax=Cryobacterium breve TaxID=1259258 RepID=A0ABY2J063_9MICO|nr:hypothetical protein [Cryobacterium breve]TFC91763.1 hypothetical protein E3T20_12945 [Cryobacterium sp. TmT3-12]TFC98312.1 hypothetical protein E3O65_08165 [Cryobacterium breve]
MPALWKLGTVTEGFVAVAVTDNEPGRTVGAPDARTRADRRGCRPACDRHRLEHVNAGQCAVRRWLPVGNCLEIPLDLPD